MNILFRAYGDSCFGLGHVYRSKALSEFLKSKGLSCYFALSENDPKELIEVSQKLLLQTVKVKEVKECNFDYLVYDMPFYDEYFFGVVRGKNLKNRIGLDYFHYETSDIDISLNLYNHSSPPSSTNFLIEESIKFAIFRESILSKGRNVEPSKSSVLRIIITFGSTDPQNNSAYVLERLPDIENFHVSIIEGPLYKNLHDIEKLCSKFKRTKISVFENVSNIEDYITKNDAVICGGGTTLLEAIYLGRPAFVMHQTQAELSFSENLEAKGLCKVLSRETEISTETFNENLRERIRENCLKFDLGSGKELIYQRLLK